jgi:RNA polymerase sigma-70 factor (ECF subfamily)
MMPETPETERLIALARAGDRAARHDLLDRHRDRLRRMVAVRLDRRLSARLDPSDVVQEALADAAGRLSDYLRDRPLPFYPWLRRLAWDRLVELQRHHGRSRRSVAREEPEGLELPDESVAALVERLAADGTSPSRDLLRRELCDRVRTALDAMGPRDQEVLALRYLEQLTTAETAAVLGISEGAVKSRLMRAILRLRDWLDEAEEENWQ